MSLGSYLKELREKKKIPKSPTLADVERAIGISSTTLLQIESGHIRSPGGDKLGALAEYYGVPVKDLINKIER
jgi:transcriptional regulator with XRE-family HTH domain